MEVEKYINLNTLYVVIGTTIRTRDDEKKFSKSSVFLREFFLSFLLLYL